MLIKLKLKKINNSKMSMHLKQTSTNLNRSTFFYTQDQIFNPKLQEQIHKDIALSYKVFDPIQTMRMSNVCLDRCIEDFKTPNLSAKESSCLLSCRKEIGSFFFNLNN